MSQNRVILEHLTPEVEGGRFYTKRIVGETLQVEIDLFADGHDVVNGHLLYRMAKTRKWHPVQLRHLGNDRWAGAIELDQEGMLEYKVQGWVDYALNWQHQIEKKAKDGQNVSVELADGLPYLDHLIKKTKGDPKKEVKKWRKALTDAKQYDEVVEWAIGPALHALLLAHPQKQFMTEYPTRQVSVDRKKAGFSTWYELFPRSASSTEGQHGTFKDVEALLPRVVEMGFDTLYMPPIHPIGRINRKGKNNSTTAEAGEPGSCWGVGADEGGHTAIHPELGNLKDFKRLIKAAGKAGIEVAMDIAFQCTPDHPWVKEHPQWFRWRSDGSVQYAENPPKKYQDILPIYFETEDWKNLWQALLEVVTYWMEQGVRVFRIDNPHTKPYRFWEWLIAEVKKIDHGVIFLSEAFSRPAVMHQLAKCGFTQSYSYFTWRQNKHEFAQYMQDLTTGPGREYFRANFWPNTPDILPWHLQTSNEAVYALRYFLAATLNSNVGIYGPVFEQIVHAAVPGKEEYLDSEKYEVRHWDWEKRNKLTHVITKVNQARKDNPALQDMYNYQPCKVENEQLMAWFKQDAKSRNSLLMVANFDPHYTQSGWVQTPLDQLGIEAGTSFTVHDLISGNSYLWDQEWNFVELNPLALPFHLFRIETH